MQVFLLPSMTIANTIDHVPVLSLREIETLSKRALMGSGATDVNAGPVADSMRSAEAEGIRNVGLGYLPIYCEHLRCAKIDGAAVPNVRRSARASIVVDAAFGFAHPAFLAALDEFVEAANDCGVAALSIARSYSAGVVGWFVDHLARRGLVGLGFANSSALMPPWGGNLPVFGTNPLAFGVPRTHDEPIILDMATSATARVNVLNAASLGGPIPEGWALDTSGQPTTDPQAAIDGMMAPLGGAKGYGLALMVDVLAGALTGSNFSHESSSFGDNIGGPPGVGQLFVAFSPTTMGAASFGERVETLAGVVHAQDGARLPGSTRHEHRVTAERNGVDVPAELLDRLESYC